MKMNPKGKGNDYFETPPEIFDQLERIYNFDMDVAWNEDNCLCPKCITEKQDALKGTWIGRCFCNPPFSKKAEFIKKAVEELEKGSLYICVMILPLNCMDTKVWHEYIEDKFYYEILQGRIAFIDPETRRPKKGNNSGTVIVYFKKKIKI